VPHAKKEKEKGKRLKIYTHFLQKSFLETEE